MLNSLTFAVVALIYSCLREKYVEGARAEIALRNSWAHVADILEERVAKSLGQFQQGTHQKKKFKIYVRSARLSPIIFLA